jgi:hypothetical protein
LGSLFNKEPVMKNDYIVRTAAVVTLTAGLIGLGFMGMQGDDMQVATDEVGVSSASSEPTPFYFPAGFELRANPNEPEVFEYN